MDDIERHGEAHPLVAAKAFTSFDVHEVKITFRVVYGTEGDCTSCTGIEVVGWG